MKLQFSASQIDISLIDVPPDRQRRHGRSSAGALENTKDLEASIARNGQLTPILVEAGSNGRFILVFGERRLTACKNLGQPKIFARKVSDLSPTERRVVELEENIKRSDLEWQDLVRSVAELHRLYTETNESWSQYKTADACSLQQGTIAMYCAVAEELDNESVAKAATVREAYNKLKRRDQRRSAEALQELLDAPDVAPPPVVVEELSEEEKAKVAALEELKRPLPPELEAKRKAIWLAEQQAAQQARAREVPAAPDSILHASFLEWAPSYAGQRFNLIHCDFPYGIELFSGPQGRGAESTLDGTSVGYKDASDVYWKLVDCLGQNFDRIASVSCHLMFWLSADTGIVEDTKQRLRLMIPTLTFYKFPLIWLKSDNAGISSDASRSPRHTYEACLLASRGDRHLVQVKADAYSAPSDRRLHPSTKPEPMLRHFMEMLVDDTTLLLDPTCGSGASLRAAESLGAKQVLGLEIDKQYVAPAQLALRQARAKRAADRLSDGL